MNARNIAACTPSSHDARAVNDALVRAVHPRVVDGLLAAIGDADAVLPVPCAINAALPAASSAVRGLDTREAVAAVAFLAR